MIAWAGLERCAAAASDPLSISAHGRAGLWPPARPNNGLLCRQGKIGAWQDQRSATVKMLRTLIGQWRRPGRLSDKIGTGSEVIGIAHFKSQTRKHPGLLCCNAI